MGFYGGAAAGAAATVSSFAKALHNASSSLTTSTVHTASSTGTATSPANWTQTLAKIGIAASALAQTLPQYATNGNSEYGTLHAPTFPKFLTNNPLPQGFPWGGRTQENTDPYTQSPLTGVTRYYDFTISRMDLAPDGVNRSMIVVNKQFPGPTIEANWGDWIEVKVHNEIEDEGTSLHWHGLLQTLTPYYDGVPGVQQCPIAPGKEFTYRFKADLYGTSWWHSHYSAQYSAGAMGPMIIHGPLSEKHDYDIDLGPVFLTDWYHRSYFDIVKQVMGTNIGSVVAAGRSDNNLINGKMDYNCSLADPGVSCKPNAGLASFKFTPGKRHRLRLINAGAEGIQWFSIDGHDMKVIAHDFVPVVPYTAKMLALGIGQRIDVIVTASGKETDSVYMRSEIQTGCSGAAQPEALAIVYYPKANQTALPSDNPQPKISRDCGHSTTELSLIEPMYKLKPTTPDKVFEIEMSLGQNATGFWVWSMNNSTFRTDYNSPVLLLANMGNYSYPAEWNVFSSQEAKSVRIILKNPTPAAHPMHLHGHNMYELAQVDGLGWDGTITNPNNPARRDTHLVAANSTYVFQYDADNPGVWPFHCHIAWHVSGGLYINLMEHPDKIKRNMQIPSTMAQTCRDWSAFTGHAVVDQIDSGL